MPSEGTGRWEPGPPLPLRAVGLPVLRPPRQQLCAGRTHRGSPSRLPHGVPAPRELSAGPNGESEGAHLKGGPWNCSVRVPRGPSELQNLGPQVTAAPSESREPQVSSHGLSTVRPKPHDSVTVQRPASREVRAGPRGPEGHCGGEPTVYGGGQFHSRNQIGCHRVQVAFREPSECGRPVT